MRQSIQAAPSLIARSLSWARVRQIGFSVADQGLSAGGMFLANIALARTQSKEEYGIFALSYSLFTLLGGLHNAAILEAYTIFGSGRYHQRFASYTCLLWQRNLWLLGGTTAALTLTWLVLAWAAPAMASPTTLGMALTSGILLSAIFLRRTLYMRRRPETAARFSATYFLAFALLLWRALCSGILNGFYTFIIAAMAWCLAAVSVAWELPAQTGGANFSEMEPGHWAEHWKYSRWVLVTAFVFQLTTQAYYWLAAAYLSVKEVAELRAMYNLVTPVEQMFAAITLLILPVLSLRHATLGVGGVVPLWKGYCLAWLGVTGTFATIVNIFARPMMHMLYAGRFDDVASLVGILALVPLVMGIGNTMNAALKALEKPQKVFFAYIASGSATLLAGIPLITHLGLRGAVYGLLVSAAVYTAALGMAFAASVYTAPLAGSLRAAPKEAPPA